MKFLVLVIVGLVLLQINLSSAQSWVKKCSKGSECAADECCLYTVQTIGKKRQLIVPVMGGVCTKKPTLSEKCVDPLNTDVDYDSQIAFSCPCQNSQCVRNPNAILNVPSGYDGICKN